MAARSSLVFLRCCTTSGTSMHPGASVLLRPATRRRRHGCPVHVDFVALRSDREPMKSQAFKELTMFRHVAAEDLSVDVPLIVDDPDPKAWFIGVGTARRAGGCSNQRPIPDRNRGARDERRVHETFDRS